MKPDNLTNLIDNLERAEKYLSKFKGGFSGKYLCATEFHYDFKVEIEKLKQGNQESIETLYKWFSPTCEWDDFTNSDDQSTYYGNYIFKLLENLKHS